MRKYSHDTTLRVRIFHRPGQLARFAAAIAEEGALIGEISTHRNEENSSVRDITVETSDEAHTQRVIQRVSALADVSLISVTDRVFECHKGGKIHSTSRIDIRHETDLRYIYTPGVARVSRAIQERPDLAWELTGIGNSVGIFTNGTRVLGLGDIGPLASLPVMEGKALLYDRCASISATPLLIDSKDPDEMIETVVRLSKSFGGIHLEDIRIPDCFYIERELDRRIDKPVMHDDQHGTATVALAALINACRSSGVDPKTSRVGQIGLGAAGSAIARMALAFGAKEVLVTDVSPEAVKRLTSEGASGCDLDTLMKSADIVIATTGRPGLIRASMIRKNQVIFSLSNPDPEIDPDEAVRAGAAFAGDGRSINNALAYPGIFKGALAARTKQIVPSMFLAAAHAIASLAEKGELVPSPLNPEVHKAVQKAVYAQAVEAGLLHTARL